MDCHEIEFSAKNSKNRISNAMGILEPAVLFRMLAFALHMMGAKRKTIAFQFFIETLIIGQLGGIVGITAGFNAFRVRAQYGYGLTNIFSKLNNSDLNVGSGESKFKYWLQSRTKFHTRILFIRKSSLSCSGST